jgi:uncharacterized protein YjiS (DUF1127 family)
MTTSNTTFTPAFGGLSGAFAAIRKSLTDKARRAHAYRETYRQLDAMTDRELADIGISRLQIRDIAEEAASCA